MTIIPPKSSDSFHVKAGQKIKITDPEGSQVADLVCFNAEDRNEFLSQGNTRINNQTLRITTGHELFSNFHHVMMEIVEDTVGVHDILYSPCNTWLYEEVFDVGPRNGCFENLGRAIEQHGIHKGQVPHPFNIFMHTDLTEDYQPFIKTALSKPGDYLTLEAKMDCLVAVSSCAEDISDCNGGYCTTIQVEVFDSAGQPIKQTNAEILAQ